MTLIPMMSRLLAIALLVPAVAAQAQRAGAPDADSTVIRDRTALLMLERSQLMNMVADAEAMPADKYGFAPTIGEFTGVRTFRQQLKHLSATNYMLAFAALGRPAPADAGDETGPESARTKEEVIAYLRGSYAVLDTAILAIGDHGIPVHSSPISPMQGNSATRLALVVESLVHAYDHYGQMAVYLRMNGVVPPASRR